MFSAGFFLSVMAAAMFPLRSAAAKNATAVFFMFRFIEVPPFFLYHKYNTVRRLNPVGAGMPAVQFCSSI